MMGKKGLLLVLLLGLVALDGAALHDILRGEPDLRLEWLVVILSAVVVVLLVTNHLARRPRTSK